MPRAADAATVVARPGDTGRISIELTNASDSTDIEGVKVEVTGKPDYFHVTSPDPGTLPAATAKTILIEYAIAADAPKANFTVGLNVLPPGAVSVDPLIPRTVAFQILRGPSVSFLHTLNAQPGVQFITEHILPRDVDFSISSSVDLSTLTITGPGGPITPITQNPADATGARSVTGRIDSKTPGNYSLIATDIGGQQTQVNWVVDTLQVSISTESTASIDGNTGLVTTNLKLDFSASQNLYRWEQLDSEYNVVDKVSLTGPSDRKTYTVTSQAVTDSPTVVHFNSPNGIESEVSEPKFGLRDDKGNVVLADMFITNGSFGGSAAKPYPHWGSDSPLYDLFTDTSAWKLLPGSVMLIGERRSIMQGYTSFYSPLRIGRVYGPTTTLPYATECYGQNFGQVTLTLQTGPSPEQLTSSTIVDSEVQRVAGGFDIPDLVHASVPVNQYFKLSAVLDPLPQQTFCLDECDTLDAPWPDMTSCTGQPSVPEITWIGPRIEGPDISLSSEELPGVVAGAGQNQEFPLGLDVQISQANIAEFGVFGGGQDGASRPERGFKNIAGGNIGYFLASTPRMNGPFKLSAAYSTQDLTTPQQDKAKVVQFVDGVRGEVETSNSDGALSFEAVSPLPGVSFPYFVLEAPAFPDPVISSAGEARVVADQPGVSIALAGPANVATALDRIQAQRLWRMGSIYSLSSAAGVQSPPAVVRLKYNPQAVSEIGSTPGSLSIIGFSEDGTFQPFDKVSVDIPNLEVTAEITSTAPYVGVFAGAAGDGFLPPAVTTATVDTAAPRTVLTAGAPSYSSATLFVGSGARLRLESEDDYSSAGDRLGVGVAQYYYGLDTSTLSVTGGTFTLTSEGVHQVYYLAVDAQGNHEAVRTSTVALDVTAPVSTFTVLGATGTTFGTLSFSATSAIQLSASDPLSNGTASGVFEIRYLTVDPLLCAGIPEDSEAAPGTCANPVYAGPFKLPPGLHDISFWSVDRVANSEAVHNLSFQTLDPDDQQPPRTTLVAIGPSRAAAGVLYGTDRTSFTLVAVDDLTTIGDGAGLPVAATLIQLATAPLNFYGGPFMLASEGAYNVSFYSQDAAGHAEVAHSSTIAVDLTPPSSSLTIDGSSSTNAQGGMVVTSTSRLFLGGEDPISNGVASGLGTIYYVVDADMGCLAHVPDASHAPGTCSNPVYASSFTLTNGAHTIYYQASDGVGNRDAVQFASFTVQSALGDIQPPRTVLEGGLAYSSTTLFAADGATFTLTAADDWGVEGDEAGSGVSQTFYAVDSATFTPYAGAFPVTGEGGHVVSFYSVDAASNTEETQVRLVIVDLTAPASRLEVEGSSTTAEGLVAVSSLTRVGLAAEDPVQGGAASGVDALFYVVDQDPNEPGCAAALQDPAQPAGSCANKSYAGSFLLPLGAHSVYSFARDAAGNLETVRVSSVTVLPDTFAPRSALVAGVPSHSSTTVLFVGPGTELAVMAVDDLAAAGDEAGTGVLRTYLAVDTTSYSFYTGAFSLSVEGLHSVAFFSRDRIGNAESPQSVAVAVDRTPPVTYFDVHGASATVEGRLYVSTSASLALAAFDPVSGGVASGVESIFYAIDGGSSSPQAYMGEFMLDPGTHTAYFFSRDYAGNLETSTLALTVQALPFDVLPPRTDISVEGPSFSSGTLYAAGGSTFSLTSVDDGIAVGDAAGTGVAQTFIAVDTDTFSSYAGSFLIPAEGTHTLAFYSVDHAGFAEDIRSIVVGVDLTPPASLLSTAGPGRTDEQGILIVSTATHFVLTAEDPVSSGTASGVGAILYAVDGATEATVYTGPFLLEAGTHTLSYFARDRVENAEAVHTASISVREDILAPRTVLFAGASSSTVDGLFVTSAAALGLFAQDDLSELGDSAGEVSAVYLAVDSTSYSLYSGTFSLVAEGTHTVSFYSVDWTGHAEIIQSTTVVTDISAPVTVVKILGSSVASVGGGLVISSEALVSLAPFDAGAGVSHTLYSVDGSTQQIYSEPFSLTPGTHTIEYLSTDRLGLTEEIRSSAVVVDTTAPVSLLSPDGPTRTVEDVLVVSTTTKFVLTAEDAIAGVGAIFYAVDGATEPLVYLVPFTLDAGSHTLAYFARDGVGNTEEERIVSISVREDALPPRTELLIGAPSSSAGGLFVTSATVFGLSAVDDLSVVGDGAGEVLETYLAVGGTSYSLYVGTFTLPGEGAHAISYYSVDWTGRTETALSTTAVTDLTSPVTALEILGSSAATTQAGLIVSTGPVISLAAFDAASGVAETVYIVDDGEPQLFTGPFALAPGTHTVQHRSTDRVGNVEITGTTSFTVQETPFDVLPPRTSASVGAPSFGIPGRHYATNASPVTLTAVDDGLDYGDLAGKGVTQTLYGVNTTTLAAYGGPFTIASEGLHVVRFRSVDAEGRFEAVRSTTVAVDFTPPVTELAAAPSSLDGAVLNVLADYTAITLSALEPESDGAASGLDFIEYAVDAGTAAPYTGPFTLSAGAHTLYFRARDRLGNVETLNVVELISHDVSASADLEAPTAAIVSLIDGSTLTTLSSITGTAADNLVLKEIQLAAQDLETGQWWNGAASSWTASTGPVYGASTIADLQDAATWSVDVGPGAVGAGFGAFSGFLVSSHSYQVYARAADYAGRVTDPPATASFVWHGASNTFTASGGVLDLAASATGYRTILANWTAPGDSGDSGRAASYDLRVATFSIDAGNFASATPVPTQAPGFGGASESAVFHAPVPGRGYYFALKTINNAGQVSPLSNVVWTYSGDFVVALDPEGSLWQLHHQGFGFGLFKYRSNLEHGQPFNDHLPWGSTSRALGFDADGGAYAFFSIGGAAQFDKPRAVLYNVDPDGVFVSSRPFFTIGGQQSTLNEAPGLNLAAAVDVDGTVWVAGDAAAPGQTAGLWRIDESGLSVAGLSPGATAFAVLSYGEGKVWMTGTDGELVLWRHDPASGAMTRFNWTNSLGGTGSAGKAMLETASGNVWIAGWANGPSAKVAALWRWDAEGLELVSTSTGAFGEEAEGLDLDDAGRFWLSGRSLADASGTPSLSLWTYQTPDGGPDLAHVDRRLDVPPAVDFNAGAALAVAQGRTWALAGPSPFGVRSRSLQLGELTGTVHYADGFTGGNLAFLVSDDAGFESDVTFELQPAPPFGTSASYTLTGLAAPATYYLAVIYDLSGALAASGEPGPEDPSGFSYSPSFTPSGGAAAVPAVGLTVDEQAPTIALLSPVSGSTTTATLLAISGTAADEHIVTDLQVGLERLSDGFWWDSYARAFTASAEPLMDVGALRTGRADAFSWSVDMLNLREAVAPGFSYRVHAQVSDLAGHTASASADVVIISTSVPSISTMTHSLAMGRDASGSFWVATEDLLDDRPAEFSLRKYDAAGFALSSTTLPGATNVGSFGVAFDPSGNAWVGGSGEGPNGAALSVWKVDAAGEVLLASAAVVNAGGDVFNGGIAVDGAGSAWVAGGEATGPGLAFRHGLWKFDAGAALVPGYPAYFQRGGGVLDAGMATAIDPAGNIWSAGVSSNPATGQLDLGLWKHDASGAVVFSAYRPAAFLGIQGEADADLDMTISPAGAIWIAASQAYPPFQASDLAVLRYDYSSGVLVSSSLWHAANYPIARGLSISLDPAGNPFVVGALQPSPDSSLKALWKYSASGALASGYPKYAANSTGRSLAVDGAGTPWTAAEGRPQVFSGTATLAGASGPGFFASAGFSNLSGTLTYPAGFVAGSTVSLVASRDGFDSDPAFFQLIAPGGPSLPYSVSLLAPATYHILGFVGEDPDNLAPGAPVGVYNQFAEVTLTTSAPVSGVDLAFIIDTTPPVSAFSGFVSGSTLTALARIQGTATDDTAMIGSMRLAAQDLDNGLWWDASTQNWVVSTGPVYKLLNADSLPGPLNDRRWHVEARAGAPLSADYGFGGFSDFLPYGHSFALHEKQIDLAGNEQLVPAISSFVWRGANGAFGPPDAVGDLSVFNVGFTSASLTWTAPGEHQNIGQALAYDLRYTTAATVDFATQFTSYTAAAGLPEPPPAYHNSSFTLTGLLPGKLYRLALKTINHEGGVSALSNLGSFVTLESDLPPRTNLIAGPPSFSTTTIYVTDMSALALVAVDDLIEIGDGIGEGVATTHFAVDSGTFSLYSGTFSLVGEGEHSISFFSSNTRGLVESTKTVVVALDLTAPIASLMVEGSTTDAQGIWIVTSTTTITLSAEDVPGGGVASGVGSIQYVIDEDPSAPDCASVPLSTNAPRGTCANKVYASAFTLSPGTHTVYFLAEDNVGNMSALTTSSFTVSAPIDELPPRTALFVGSPQFSTTTVYISSVTPLNLVAYDDALTIGDGLGEVSQTFVSVDSAPFAAYAGTFTLIAQGTHTIQFYSLDAAGNVEIVHVSTLTVDIVAPITILQVGGIASATTSLVLISTDSLGLSAADTDAGVAQTIYVLDGGAPNVYISTFSLAAGTHTFEYQSVDNLGNTEEMKSAFLTVFDVDTTPPEIELTPADGSTATTSSPLIVAVYSDSGRGVDPASVRVILDGVDVTTSAVVTISSAAITPDLSEGAHTVTVEVADLAGNPASASSTFNVDILPPVTTLTIGTPNFVSSSTFVTTTTPLGFTASKPGETYYSVDGGTFTVYTGTFSLTADGFHTLQFFSLDSFGHQESTQTASVTVDTLAPVTQLFIGGTPYSSGTKVIATVGASVALIALDHPAAAELASGVGEIRFLIDAEPASCPQGIFGIPNLASPAGTCDNTLYSGTFAVSAGTHTIHFASFDKLENREQVQVITVQGYSDGAPQALVSLDLAKRFQEWVDARQALLSLSSNSLTALRAYAADTSRDGRKRFIALEAVVNVLPPADGANELIDGFQDADPFFRSPIAMKMGQIGTSSFQPVLLASLNDAQENGMVQVSAAAGLASMGDAAGKPRALQAVTNAEPWSEFGMMALATLNATDTLSTLESTIQSSTNDQIRNKCRLAILRIEMVGKTQAELLPILQQALQESGFSGVHAWAAMRLQKIGNTEAGQALAAIVNGSAPGRDEAARWLSAGIGDGYWSKSDIAQWLNN